jgi:hypothetical protein
MLSNWLEFLNRGDVSLNAPFLRPDLEFDAAHFAAVVPQGQATRSKRQTVGQTIVYDVDRPDGVDLTSQIQGIEPIAY